MIRTHPIKSLAVTTVIAIVVLVGCQGAPTASGDFVSAVDQYRDAVETLVSLKMSKDSRIKQINKAIADAKKDFESIVQGEMSARELAMSSIGATASSLGRGNEIERRVRQNLANRLDRSDFAGMENRLNEGVSQMESIREAEAKDYDEKIAEQEEGCRIR